MARHLLIPQRLLALAVTVPFAFLGACKNAARSEKDAPRAEAAYANRERFESQLAEWRKRWGDVQAPGDCAQLLPPADQPSCAETRAALERVRKAVAEGKASGVIREAGALALAAQRAAQTLRKAGLAELLPEPGSRPSLTAPAPKASASALPKASSGHTRGSSSAHDHAGHDHTGRDHGPPENVHKNPTLSAILEYSRLASLALRQLGTYLEHGPPRVRAEALGELIRLSKEQPRWSGLESLAREAWLTETDADLKAKLDNLAKNLRAERGH